MFLPNRIKLLALLLPGMWACARPYQPSPALQQSGIEINAALAPHAGAEKIIAPYRQQVAGKMNEVLGQAPQALERKPLESDLGNFVADLMLEQGAKAYGKPVDMGVTTNGGLRTPIPQGTVRVGDIFELMPFENELVVLQLPGPVALQLFEFAARNHQDPKKTTAISNASYTIRDNKPADIKIGGQPLDLNRTYTIAVTDYLAGGGDDMGLLKQVKPFQTGLSLRDAILNQLRQLQAQGKPIEAPAFGRVSKVQ